MNKYNLKILFQTSTPSMGDSKQHYCVKVKADGYSISGGGRIYIFWEQPGQKINERKTIACYPTNCTIIEEIIYDKN